MLYLMNTTGIFTSLEQCTVDFSTVSVEKAKYLVLNYSFISAIGHEATIEIINTLLGTEIPIEKVFNEKLNKEVLKRINVDLQKGDLALCFQISPRPPEGVILSKEELLRDYSFKFNLLEVKKRHYEDLQHELAYHNGGFP